MPLSFKVRAPSADLELGRVLQISRQKAIGVPMGPHHSLADQLILGILRQSTKLTAT